MSKINEILVVEESNDSSIYLYKEGAFWKAYQQSAYPFLRMTNLNTLMEEKHRTPMSALI